MAEVISINRNREREALHAARQRLMVYHRLLEFMEQVVEALPKTSILQVQGKEIFDIERETIGKVLHQIDEALKFWKAHGP